MAEYQGNFNERTREVIAAAHESARRNGAACTTTRHLVTELWQDQSATLSHVVASLAVQMDQLQQGMNGTREECRPPTQSGSDPQFSAEARAALMLAMTSARELGHNYVGPAHLVLGLVREEEGAAGRALRHAGVDVDDATAAVRRFVPARRDDPAA
jgi:ATP-dependent Clp protease ATP-binding subunit ClpC